MASSNSNRFNKSDMEDELPLFELLNQIHEEERMGEDELLEMIEGYWRMVKEALATRPDLRRIIPLYGKTDNPPWFDININIENGPFFYAEERRSDEKRASDIPFGKAAERFLQRFKAEAVGFVNKKANHPFQAERGQQLHVAFTIGLKLRNGVGGFTVGWEADPEHISEGQAWWFAAGIDFGKNWGRVTSLRLTIRPKAIK